MIIAPSILSADLFDLKSDLGKVESAEWIHIDSMDGQFVPNITFGANIVSAIRPHTSKILDCHLMIAEPERYVEDFCEAGADYVTIQVESTAHVHRVLQQIKSTDTKAGIALNPGTPIELVKPVLSMVDLVLVMTVNPGFGGQEFLPETVSKIKALKQIKEENDFAYHIEVDGGITAETAPICQEAGADVFVAGSYIFGAEKPKDRIEQLKQAVK